MTLGWMLEKMSQWPESTAIVWRGHQVTYRELLNLVAFWNTQLTKLDCRPGEVVALEGDYSPQVCALFLALIERRAIIVPLTKTVAAHREEFLRTAQSQRVISFDDEDGWRVTQLQGQPSHSLLRELGAADSSGLVVFSSGSTGKNKAALHNLDQILKKFKVPRQRLTTLNFLLLDHLGGINTLFYTLANGGTVVAARSRDPEEICRLVEHHRVELLPTSPTFLNLLLLSEAYTHYDLSSLKLMTYGTEVMPESTLHRLQQAFPHVRLQQTYGLSELGVLRSKSKDSGSLWVKVGGEGFETKVVHGTLWIRAQSAMLGYLNAPSPFDSDGWMDTQDLVEVDGEYIRILGRTSEIINVGGQKVAPGEVEGVLMQLDNIRDVTVYGEPNLITGQIVAARINLRQPEGALDLKKRLRAFCQGKLAPFKIPVKVEVAGQALFSARYKKTRPGSDPNHLDTDSTDH